jgi:RNA polymerase sigma-70 factor (ECF subfamily)
MEAARVTESDDGALVERVRQGDRDAFVGLMRRYNARVFRIARAILPDDAEAEDAAQEAWVLAWRHLHQFEGRSRFSTWLARIAAREATARARKRRLVLAPDVVEHAMDEETTDAERLASDGEARALLEEAIDGLPEAFRAVFVMRSVEDMSVAETALVLGIPEDTVKTRLHRARKALREDLARRFDAAADGVFGFDGARCDRMVANVLARIQTA